MRATTDPGPAGVEGLGTSTIRGALKTGQAALVNRSASPRLDAELLLCEALGADRSHLYAHPDSPLPPDAAEVYQELIARRARGESVAVLRGSKEFWSLDLLVRPGVLVPRPDTELLVETALTLMDADAAQIADLGTGSGAIALALATERRAWSITAIDTSGTALKLACHNAERLGITTVQWVRGEWLSPMRGGRLDLIVSNPPYIACGDPHLTGTELAYEPRAALISGADGLDAIRVIVAQAPQALRPGGRLILEHGDQQGEAVRGLFDRARLTEVETHRDLGGRERITAGRLSP